MKQLFFFNLLLLFFFQPATAQKKSFMTDYQAIIESVTSIFTATDNRDWATIENAFAPKVLLDYSSLSGSPAATLTPAEIITAWKSVLPGFTHTHHQMGNFKVVQQGKEATVTCYGTASHYLPNSSKQNLWTVVGSYDFHLVQTGAQWKTDKMVLHFKYQDGNTTLPSLAIEKVKQAAANKTTSNNMTNATAVTEKTITFSSEGLTLTGKLYFPPGFDASKKYAATFVEGSWLTVKEQMATLYAKRIAAEGFLALTFDFRYYGESEGQPRNFESPEAKIADMKNAVTFLLSLPYVDESKVYGTGICASAQYLARVAAEDNRIKSIALIAPWMHNASIVREVYGGEEGVQARIAAGRAAKVQYANTGEVTSVPAVSETDRSAAMYGPFSYYLDTKRGAIPAWANKMATMSWPEWLEYDGIRSAPNLRTPVLLVHSEQAAIPQGARAFFEQVPGNKKEIHWTTGGQFDFYDQDPQVSFSVDKIIHWFTK